MTIGDFVTAEEAPIIPANHSAAAERYRLEIIAALEEIHRLSGLMVLRIKANAEADEDFDFLNNCFGTAMFDGGRAFHRFRAARGCAGEA
jgi:hypothetical protein